MTLLNDIILMFSSTLTQKIGMIEMSGKIPVNLHESLPDADGMFSADTSLDGAAASYDLDGDLTDPVGQPVQFATVLALFIQNKSPLPLAVGGANSLGLLNGSTDRLILPAAASATERSWLAVCCAIPVVADTGDLLIISSTVADWSEGTYPAGTYKRHGDPTQIYRVIAAVETALEPGVDEGWEDDWETIAAESYELAIIGVKKTP